jgi:hypothetical protein
MRMTSPTAATSPYTRIRAVVRILLMHSKCNWTALTWNAQCLTNTTKQLQVDQLPSHIQLSPKHGS